jgi:hypothetical protein
MDKEYGRAADKQNDILQEQDVFLLYEAVLQVD